MSKYIRVKDKLDTRDHKYKVTSAVDYPRSVDLRKYCSPVEDQRQEGSCTGHAIVGAMEFLENIQQEEPVRLSRAFVYFNELLLEGNVGKDAGASLRDGIKIIAKYGVCAERLWPYT